MCIAVLVVFQHRPFQGTYVLLGFFPEEPSAHLSLSLSSQSTETYKHHRFYFTIKPFLRGTVIKKKCLKRISLFSNSKLNSYFINEWREHFPYPNQIGWGETASIKSAFIRMIRAKKRPNWHRLYRSFLSTRWRSIVESIRQTVIN